MKHRFRITFNAPVILSFVLLCFGATLLGQLTGGKATQLLFMTYRAPLNDPMTWLRLVTHVIGHADWAHFIGNASYLLLLGPMLEEKHGPMAIAGIILTTALITGVVNTIFFPRVAVCGASGVVFAFILLTSYTSFREGELPVTVLLVAAIYIGQQMYDGIVLKDNISNMAHILGGVTGGAIGYELNKKSKCS